MFRKILLSIILGGLALSLGYLSAWLPMVLIGALSIGIVLCALILKEPLWGMWLLIFFLPFERIGSLDAFGITIRISQVVAALMMCAWIIRGLSLQKFKFRAQPLVWLILIFLIENLFALCLNAPNPERSLSVWAFTAFTLGVSIILPQILRHKEQLPMVIKILISSMACVCLFGLYQFMGDIIGLPTSLTGLRELYTKEILGFPRIQATALEPLYFANYLLLPLSVIISLWLSKASKLKPLLLLGLIILGGLNLVLTVARGGYIAFATSLIILGIFYWQKIIRLRVIIPGILVATLILWGAFRFLNLESASEDFTAHVTNIFSGASYAERVETFSLAEGIWREHPYLGIGPGSFGPYTSYHPYKVPADGYKIVNNLYLELLAETGLLGIGLIIVILLVLIIRGVYCINKTKDKYLKALLIGLLAALGGMLVQYNTFSVLYIMHIWFTVGLLLAAQNIALHKKIDRVTIPKEG